MSPATPTKPLPAMDKQQASIAVQREASFRPSVLSTRRVNFRFSEATHDNGPNKSLMKTPARLSTPPLRGPEHPGETERNRLLFSPGTQVSSPTPPGINHKPSFNLKAGLSKTLSYTSLHKGKLKPFGEAELTQRLTPRWFSRNQKND
ncbi:hypothetical protein NHX12_022007 [Muraenolepis orangiensis]|uniref:Uncharacterized protein n=1 Tax=Muraenolepis orangiensis TaxID=630683 RepID=A0A9Q0ITU2_9TELE|nr:hypothetical protein NHX12_022007 [Muraenolepis orangiensis]